MSSPSSPAAAGDYEQATMQLSDSHSQQADYEVQLTKSFKKLKQYWSNRSGVDGQISKCIFYLEAYGISPSLQVGYEEALYLAQKIKSSLGSKLNTEKMLYLLLLTLKRQEHGDGEAGDAKREQQEQDVTTFQAFIIRYLYHLREQHIVSQVQKMNSIDQVRQEFRAEMSPELLQFHEIDALSSREIIDCQSAISPRNFNSSEQEIDLGDGDQEGKVYSSKFYPERCARNSQGQFLKRNGFQQVAPSALKLENLEETSCEKMPKPYRSRDFKRSQKEQQKKARYEERSAILGKRSRPQLTVSDGLEDAPSLVFSQTSSRIGTRMWDRDAREALQGLEASVRNFGVSPGDQILKLRTGSPKTHEDFEMVDEHGEQLDESSVWKIVSAKTLAARKLGGGLLGGNPESQDSKNKIQAGEPADDQSAPEEQLPSNDSHQAQINPEEPNKEDQAYDKSHTLTDQSAADGSHDLKKEHAAIEINKKAGSSAKNEKAKAVNGNINNLMGFVSQASELEDEAEKDDMVRNQSQSEYQEESDQDQDASEEEASGDEQGEDELDELIGEEDDGLDDEEAEVEEDQSSDMQDEEENGEKELQTDGIEVNNLESKPLDDSHGAAGTENEGNNATVTEKSKSENGEAIPDVDMKDVNHQDDSQIINNSKTPCDVSLKTPQSGRVTKIYTVYKLQTPKPSDKSGISGSKAANQKKKAAGIYQMLMRITHGICKPNKISASKLASKSKSLLALKPSSASLKKAKLLQQQQKMKKEVIDPQLALYQEQDIRLALASQSNALGMNAPVVKRRAKQNYLSYIDPFDLNVLLDEPYWSHKASRLAHGQDEIIRLSKLNKVYDIGTFESNAVHEFLDFKESVNSPTFTVKHLFWQNTTDSAVPYQSGFKDHYWNYIQVNEIYNTNIWQYLHKAKRQSFCNCLDGCQNSRKCPCYKWNRKLQNPTYNKILSPRSGEMIAFQPRAKNSINKVFSFNECHPRCHCNKDLCQNFLIAAQNKKKFKFIIRRIRKTLSPVFQIDKGKDHDKSDSNKIVSSEADGSDNKASSGGILSQRPKHISMWGLFAMEEIPAGAFLMEYLGEIVSKKQGDMRGTYYDDNGLSYLFDLNDPSEGDEREQIIQKAYHNEFFPLCLDSMFYGNEARFINHSCDPNVLSFNLTGQVDSNVYHSIGLFATRNIIAGEELTIDYQWDKNDLSISQDVPCLCGSYKCRGFLMRAKKTKKERQNMNIARQESQLTSKQDDTVQVKSPPVVIKVSDPKNESLVTPASEAAKSAQPELGPQSIEERKGIDSQVVSRQDSQMIELQKALVIEQPVAKTAPPGLTMIYTGEQQPPTSRQPSKDCQSQQLPGIAVPNQMANKPDMVGKPQMQMSSKPQQQMVGKPQMQMGQKLPVRPQPLASARNLTPSYKLPRREQIGTTSMPAQQTFARPPGPVFKEMPATRPRSELQLRQAQLFQPMKSNILLPPAAALVKQANSIARSSQNSSETRRFKQVKNIAGANGTPNQSANQTNVPKKW